METVTTGCEGKLKNAIGGGVTKTRYKKKKKNTTTWNVDWIGCRPCFVNDQRLRTLIDRSCRFAWPKWGTSNHCGIYKRNKTPAMVWSYHSLITTRSFLYSSTRCFPSHIYPLPTMLFLRRTQFFFFLEKK